MLGIYRLLTNLIMKEKEMISRRLGSRWFVIGSSLLVACLLGLSMQGCSGPVAKANRVENKVDHVEGQVDTRVEDAGDRAGNKASDVERKAKQVDRILN